MTPHDRRGEDARSGIAGPKQTMYDLLLSMGLHARPSPNPQWPHRFLCPFTEHATPDFSLGITADGQGFKCSACGVHGGSVRRAEELLGHGPRPRAADCSAPPHVSANGTKTEGVTWAHLQGCSIEQLAAAKSLSRGFLIDKLGWRNTMYMGRTPAIMIPYPCVGGDDLAIRYRVGLTGAKRFLWQTGTKTRLYGLHILPTARELGYLVVVEGKTNTASLLQHNIPAVGVPGKSNWRPDWAEPLRGLQVYVWPDADDTEQVLLKAVASSLPIAGVIGPKAEGAAAKGAANDLLAPDPAGFQATVFDLLAQAQPLTVAPPEEEPPLEEPKGYQIPEDTWEEPPADHWESYVPPRYRQQRNDEFQPHRARLVGAYEEAGDIVAANKLRRCAIYLTPLSWGAGNVESVPCHCNILGCPTCAFVRLHFLLREKEDSLFHLTHPTIYCADNVFTLALPLGIEAKGDIFRLGVKAVRTLLSRAAQRKEVPALILHCVESFSCKVIDTDNGPMASFGVRLLGNWGEDNVAQLTAALQRVPPKLNHQLATRVSPVDDLALQVEEVRFDDGPENSSPRAASKALRANRRAAIETFQKLAVLAFSWEDNQDFSAWKVAQKRQKLVHGRGVFAKVSGSKPESPVPTGGMNPETGEMDTFIRHPNLVAPPYMWEAFHSEHTDRIHYRFKSGYSLENCIDFRSLPEDADGGGG